MNLDDYGNQNINEFLEDFEQENLPPEDKTTIGQINKQYGSKIEELIDKFQNLDEEQLIQEVLKIINQKKAEGTYNPEELLRMANMIKPLLTMEQQKKLENLIIAIL